MVVILDTLSNVQFIETLNQCGIIADNYADRQISRLFIPAHDRPYAPGVKPAGYGPIHPLFPLLLLAVAAITCYPPGSRQPGRLLPKAADALPPVETPLML